MRFALLLAALFALPAWGAEYWVDCDAGNDGSDGLSEGAPKLTLASITQADGDVIRIKGGTTCRETLLQTAANLAVSAYGSGRFIIDGEGTRDYGVDTDAKNLTISGFDIRNHVKNNIQFEVNSAGNYSLTASDGISQSTLQLAPATSDVTYGTGFLVTSTGEGGRTGSIGAIITVNIDGVQSNDNGRHGFDFRGNVNGTLRNFNALRNGGNQVLASGGAHGVTFHPHRQEWISQTWTSVGGGVYSRARQSSSDTPVHVVWWGNGATKALKENTVTPTTPAAGEWGFSSPTIYVNLDGTTDPSTQTIRYTRVPFGPFEVTDGEAAWQKVDSGGGEGNGIACDSTSYRIRFRRIQSHDNEGQGFNAVASRDCLVESSVFWNNQRNLRAQQWTIDTRLINVSGHSPTEENIYILDGRDYEIRNAAMRGGKYGVRVSGTATGTSSNLVATGASTTLCANATCTDADPLFLGGPNPTTAEGFRPGYGSPLVGAGTPVGVKYDFSGYRFNVPPTIGAHEVPGQSVFKPFR